MNTHVRTQGPRAATLKFTPRDFADYQAIIVEGHIGFSVPMMSSGGEPPLKTWAEWGLPADAVEQIKKGQN